MKKETIDKAATDSCVIDNGIINPQIEPFYEQGFRDGARWRINSVWHDASEEPTKFCDLLLIKLNNGEFDLGYEIPAKAASWAYVKDLLPIKEDGK